MGNTYNGNTKSNFLKKTHSRKYERNDKTSQRIMLNEYKIVWNSRCSCTLKGNHMYVRLRRI